MTVDIAALGHALERELGSTPVSEHEGIYKAAGAAVARINELLASLNELARVSPRVAVLHAAFVVQLLATITGARDQGGN